MKEFAKDLKTIYTAPDEKQVRKRYSKMDEKYPTAMNRWKDNCDVISLIFKFSANVKTAFYTTNAIESQALLKALYLATFESTKKWTMPIRN